MRFRSEAAKISFSFEQAWAFFSNLSNAGLAIGSAGALGLYLATSRSRYFGNTAPLLSAVVLFGLVMTGAPGSPWIWGLPFLLTFIGGVFADAYESPRGRTAIAAGVSVVVLQAVFCILSLPALL